jgi:hypothetical protein
MKLFKSKKGTVILHNSDTGKSICIYCSREGKLGIGDWNTKAFKIMLEPYKLEFSEDTFLLENDVLCLKGIETHCLFDLKTKKTKTRGRKPTNLDKGKRKFIILKNEF